MTKVVPPFIRTANNYDMKAASDESGLKCEDESLAIQSSKDECDINVIVERNTRGIFPNLNVRDPVFGDFTHNASDYHNAMNVVGEANSRFYELPAALRARFENSPEKLLRFIGDRRNYAEAVELGLIDKKSEEDLSTGPPARHSTQAGGPVGKSGPSAKPSGRLSNEAVEGDEGE